jgi:4-hydroxybenzoyl-CoA thioesterase
MVVLERAVRFDEVDAAGIVFFAQIVAYVHEAMEHFFEQLEGGYPRLIMERRVGVPAVKLAADFSAPLRYGDRMRIETTVARIGGRSAELLYRIHRERDGVLCATLRHTVVVTDLDKLASREMPADVRAALEAHLVQFASP